MLLLNNSAGLKTSYPSIISIHLMLLLNLMDMVLVENKNGISIHLMLLLNFQKQSNLVKPYFNTSHVVIKPLRDIDACLDGDFNTSHVVIKQKTKQEEKGDE